MQTDNLELKKLVYLYLMNYAKSQPDMAIMAVNSFVKASPLTRSPRQSLIDGLFL
jgi:AP-1 complex subunit beta-1